MKASITAKRAISAFMSVVFVMSLWRNECCAECREYPFSAFVSHSEYKRIIVLVTLVPICEFFLKTKGDPGGIEFSLFDIDA